MTDLELLEQWREGDRSAGEKLFDRHYTSVARFFRNKVSYGVDDLVQNTFLACVEGRDRFAGKSSFRTYLFGVAHNLLREFYRKKKKDEKIDFGSVSVHDLAPGPSTLIGKRKEETLMVQALRRLPVEHQVLLELYYWEEMRAIDIAEIVDAPEGTVRTRIRRAKQLLEAALTELAESGDVRDSTLSGLEDWATALRDRADAVK